MQIKELLIVLSIFVLFNTDSIHTAQRPFNSDHEMKGIEVSLGHGYFLSYLDFFNSHWRRSQSISMKKIYDSGLGYRFMYATGYDFKFALFPVLEFRTGDVQIEIGWIPSIHENKINHVVLITKKWEF